MPHAWTEPPIERWYALAAFTGLYFALHCVLTPALTSRSSTYMSLPTGFEKGCWSARVTGNIHVVLCTAAGLYSLWTLPAPFLSAEGLVLAHTWELEHTMLHTSGYLLWDLCDKLRMMARHPGASFDGGPLIAVHHLMGVFGYHLSIGYGRGSTLFVLYILTELTTPCVANLYFCEKAGDQRQRTLTGVALLGSFVPVRLALSPFCFYVLWRFWDEAFADMAVPYRRWMIGSLGAATALNYYWFSRILIGSLRALGVLKKKH